MTDASRRTQARILTQHPEGKQGVNITRVKYDAMRRALLRVIPRTKVGVAFRDLSRLVRDSVDARVFPAGQSVTWYVTTVKLDLQARGEIEVIDGARPQRLRRLARPSR